MRYRRLFHLSHYEYLEEPATTVTWLLTLDQVTSEEGPGDE